MTSTAPIAKPPMTPEQRKDRARKAAEARWSQNLDWNTCPVDEGLEHLAVLRLEAEKGGIILQERLSNNRVEKVECYNPDCFTNPETGQRCKVEVAGAKRTIIDVGSARFAGYRTRHNPDTGVVETAYACSAACYIYLGSNFTHQSARPIKTLPVEPEVVMNEAAKDGIISR